MIILQAPMGNLGFHLIRAVHRGWPDHFNYLTTGTNGTWKNDNYRPDIFLPNPHVLSDAELQQLAGSLGSPCLVLTSNIATIPPQLLGSQVPDSKKFRIVLNSTADKIKAAFCHWLGDFNSQLEQADSNRETVEFYQNLWQQLSVRLLDTPESTQGQAITDLGSLSGVSAFLAAVQQEFGLGSPTLSDSTYDDFIQELYTITMIPVAAFEEHYLWFEGLCNKILGINNTFSQYQQVLDAQEQQRFRTVMDFFAFKKDFYNWSPEIYDRWYINWREHFPA